MLFRDLRSLSSRLGTLEDLHTEEVTDVRNNIIIQNVLTGF